MRTTDIARDRRRSRTAAVTVTARAETLAKGVAFHPKTAKRQSTVAPRAEPSTRGAKQWTAGRRTKRKAR